MGDTSRLDSVDRWVVSKLRHPCIYYENSKSNPGRITVIGITSDMNQRLPEYSCDLPWQHGGHPETGLVRQSIAQAHWVMPIPETSVKEVIGYTPIAIQHVIATALALRLERVLAERARANQIR
jgi:hypothetical protein